MVLEEGERLRRANITLYESSGPYYLLNTALRYKFKVYAILSQIWPVHGPGRGGTMIEVRGMNFIGEAIC